MNIVIVDDNPTNVFLLQHLVAKLPEGHPVTFTDPQVALDWCRNNTPDLVIVDYMMPEVDGLEFLTRFRGMDGRADIPAVMVTTADLKEVRYEALNRGATDFLTKPVDTTEFTARVTNLLRLRSSQKKLENHAAWLAEEVAKATSNLIARENEVILRLSKAAEHRDPETGLHIMRMAHYSRLIGAALDLDDDTLDLLYRAAPMHDIGKVGISDDILLKPDKLDPGEFAIMKTHPTIGHAILKDSPSKLLQIAADIALNHHEKFDGSGYPRGLVGEAIPLVGRIVAVADVFDALTSERPYKKAWPVDQAKELILGQSGRHFDPACVTGFEEMFKPMLTIKGRFQD